VADVNEDALVGEVTGVIDVAIADAIMVTSTPSALPGTPLERAEAALQREPNGSPADD
jgi:hypothetical protein